MFQWKLLDGWDIVWDRKKEKEEILTQIAARGLTKIALLWYDSEVNNRGHDQFFSNSTRSVWKDAIEGMKMIGAIKYAENFQKAMDMFGGNIPFERDERNMTLEKLCEDKCFRSQGSQVPQSVSLPVRLPAACASFPCCSAFVNRRL